MIIDTTGIILIPGNGGKDCPGSWEFAGLNCCCDECDYMMCCLETHNREKCYACKDRDCPRAPGANGNLTELLKK